MNRIDYFEFLRDPGYYIEEIRRGRSIAIDPPPSTRLGVEEVFNLVKNGRAVQETP